MRQLESKGSVLVFMLIIVVTLLGSNALLAAPSVHDAIMAGDACYNKGDFMGALWHFTAAKDLDPNQAGNWEKMAWAAGMAGKTADALNFVTEAEKRGMDKPRLARVRAWIYMKIADTDREAGRTDNAKTNYQHVINFASGGVDEPLAHAARTRLNELSGSSTATTASGTAATDGTDDPAAPGELKPPSKEEIESRIKEFAAEKNLTTFTDANGRMQVKDSAGNVVPLGPEIFAPSGKMPGKDVIEARIKKWAATVGLTTATDEKSGRLVAKDSNGNVVPLPPSIFYPDRTTATDTASVATDTAKVATDTAKVASDSADTSTTASTAAKLISVDDTSVSSPEDTLLGDD